MGPKGRFFHDFVGRNASSKRVPLSHAAQNGSRKAVDLAGWVHKALKGRDSPAPRMITCDPKYSPDSVRNYIENKDAQVKASGLHPVYYFEGDHNKLKSMTNKARGEEVTLHKRKLEELYEKARKAEQDPANDPITKKDLENANAWRKKAVAPDEDIYAMLIEMMDENGWEYYCSPTEAEHQMVADEAAGFVSGAISEDGDFVALGVDQLITQIEYKPNGESTAIVIYCKEWIERKRESDGGSWNTSDLPVIAALMGCDYIPHLDGFGPATVKAYLEKYTALSPQGRLDMLRTIEATADLPDSAGGGCCEGWAALFTATVNFFRHAPVFRRYPSTPYVPINPRDPSTYTVNLEPLHPCSSNSWGHDIGYGCSIEEALQHVRPGNYKEALTLQIWPRTGSPMQRDVYPTYSAVENRDVADGTRLPAFARLDIEKQPVSIQPEQNLVLCAASRGIFFSADTTRKELENKVRDIILSEARVYPPIIEAVDQAWTGFEALTTSSGGAQWSYEYVKEIQSLKPTTDAELNRKFGEGLNGVRGRGIGLLQGGFFDVKKLQRCNAGTILDKNMDVMVIRCPCLASHKTIRYSVHLCFEKKEGGSLLPAPFSSCSCPVGSLFCSHMLGLLLIIAIIQSDESLDEAFFVKHMPVLVRNLEHMPLLVEQIAVKEQVKKTKKRKKKKKKGGGSSLV